MRIREKCKRKQPSTAELLYWTVALEKLDESGRLPISRLDAPENEAEKKELISSYSLLIKNKDDWKDIGNAGMNPYRHVIEFVEALRKEGFQTGVDTYLQVAAVCRSLPPDTEEAVLVRLPLPALRCRCCQPAAFQATVS
jgi:hypothetical protein